jgi:hypothetical protein
MDGRVFTLSLVVSSCRSPTASHRKREPQKQKFSAIDKRFCCSQLRVRSCKS